VLGTAPSGARVHPCRSWNGPVADLLDELGDAGVLQVLVEGGATVARSLMSEDLVDRVVVYVAPALFGGDDALGLFRGPGSGTIADIRRGRFVDVRRLGPDLRIEVDLRSDRSPSPSSLEAT
jgi:diaminohydroxyphosphoribosylaminopyrimidine deaminase/5-amino-6-(5-phosphoribosylamino)uracil reductase